MIYQSEQSNQSYIFKFNIVKFKFNIVKFKFKIVKFFIKKIPNLFRGFFRGLQGFYFKSTVNRAKRNLPAIPY